MGIRGEPCFILPDFFFLDYNELYFVAGLGVSKYFWFLFSAGP